MDKILFTKVRETKLPSVAYSSDAGIDFYIPNASESFYKDLLKVNEKVMDKNEDLFHHSYNEKLNILYDKKTNDLEIQIGPGSRVLIPAGIKTIFDSSMALVALNKSGIATKFGLVIGAQVIDSGYRGEIHISLINTSNVEKITLKPGDKIAQFVPIKLFDRNLQEVTNEEYEKLSNEIKEKFENGNSRSEGGFGSSNSKKF